MWWGDIGECGQWGTGEVVVPFGVDEGSKPYEKEEEVFKKSKQ